MSQFFKMLKFFNIWLKNGVTSMINTAGTLVFTVQ